MEASMWPEQNQNGIIRTLKSILFKRLFYHLELLLDSVQEPVAQGSAAMLDIPDLENSDAEHSNSD